MQRWQAGVRNGRREKKQGSVRDVGKNWRRKGKRSGRCKRAGEKRSNWSGNTEYARSVGRGFFPLDEELRLLPGMLTPLGCEQLVRLSGWMPFERAAEMFTDFT